VQYDRRLTHCRQPHQVDRLLVSIFIDIALLYVHLDSYIKLARAQKVKTTQKALMESDLDGGGANGELWVCVPSALTFLFLD
jgi:hypothetical protein